jgi:hypothetical protein
MVTVRFSILLVTNVIASLSYKLSYIIHGIDLQKFSFKAKKHVEGESWQCLKGVEELKAHDSTSIN